MKKEYKITGTYRGNTEVVDTAETKKDAIKYANEYRLSFGNEWIIKIK